MAVKVKFAVRSEVGNVRKNNEDNFYCNGIFMTVSERERPFFLSGITDSPCIFAVCDGMGGEDCGELASLTAVQTLSEQEHSRSILKGILHSNESIAYEAVHKYVKDTNRKLLDIMRSQGIRMGSTLVSAVIGADSFTLYSLGDSRGFRVNNGRLLLATEDHTVAAEKVRMGLLTPEQGEKSREKHMLTRFLGDNDEWGAMPDASRRFDFAENSGGLMCSDGLTDMLTFREIAEIMKDCPEPADAVNRLVDSALAHGGHDNVTCLVFRIEKGEVKNS